MFRFTLMSQMCKDMEQMHDVLLPPDRIRQDVARSPGGDSRVFLNNCIGCHTGMDPLAQAFAYYNFNETTGRIEYTAGTVQPKYLINSDNFAPGLHYPERRLDQLLAPGPEQRERLEQRAAGQWQWCQVHGRRARQQRTVRALPGGEKVFKTVCLHPPVNQADRNAVDSAITQFKGGGYKLKDVFAQTAAYCKGN